MRSTTQTTADAAHPQLQRQIGLGGAVLMGLGSIVGTGVFVSIGIAAGIAGSAVVWAIAVAALVATCNAFSSAQLAASHPLSGGTYEYGYRYLRPWLGFTAGWMFLCAKTASAATAALGFAGYLLTLLGRSDGALRSAVAATTVLVITLIVLGGIRRSSFINSLIVLTTLVALSAFVLAGIPSVMDARAINLDLLDFSNVSLAGFLEACALMFVAYTGYGRIATMGEEVHEPRRTIPQSIVITLVVSAILYVAVGVVAIGSIGSSELHQATQSSAAPLEVAARSFAVPGLPLLVGVGAMTAMLGVLLNLVLGLSRVLLAMGRRGDMPQATAKINFAGTTPYIAVILVGTAIAGLTFIGSVQTTWSFSAFTVLVYYAITNLAALRLPKAQRLYSPLFAWIGLAACLFLAFWVDWQVWLTGLVLIAVGIIWHIIAQRLARGRRARGRLRSC